MSKPIEYKWGVYWWFVGWTCISFGFHIDVGSPNIEIHLPFGFIRIGRIVKREYTFEEMSKDKAFGYESDWKPIV